jgi:hypothetical protein
MISIEFAVAAILLVVTPAPASRRGLWAFLRQAPPVVDAGLARAK